MQLFRTLAKSQYITIPLLPLKRKRVETGKDRLYTLHINILSLIAFLLVLPNGAVAQQDNARANKGVAEPLGIDRKDRLSSQMADQATVLTLYSSQACAFCPEADRFFTRLVEQTDIIALACHIDYFDVSTGALSESFCTKRQQRQVAHIPGAMIYTPQLIINGRYDVVGHKYQRVADQLIAAVAQDNVSRLDITEETDNKGVYQFILPQHDFTGEGSLWLAVYDEPHELEIAEGTNKGKNMEYVHVVSVLEKLGPWDGSARTVEADLAPRDTHAGFVIWGEDSTGKILAAGEYRLRDQ